MDFKGGAAFSTSRFCDWKKDMEKSKKHEQFFAHKEAFENFIVAQNTKKLASKCVVTKGAQKIGLDTSCLHCLL